MQIYIHSVLLAPHNPLTGASSSKHTAVARACGAPKPRLSRPTRSIQRTARPVTTILSNTAHEKIESRPRDGAPSKLSPIYLRTSRIWCSLHIVGDRIITTYICPLRSRVFGPYRYHGWPWGWHSLYSPPKPTGRKQNGARERLKTQRFTRRQEENLQHNTPSSS